MVKISVLFILLFSSCGGMKKYIANKYRENGYFKDKYPEKDSLLLRNNSLVVGKLNIYYQNSLISEYCTFSVFEDSEKYDELRYNFLRKDGVLRIPIRTNKYQLAGFTCLPSDLNPYIEITFRTHSRSFEGKFLNLGEREIKVYRKFIDYTCKQEKRTEFIYGQKIKGVANNEDFCSDKYL